MSEAIKLLSANCSECGEGPLTVSLAPRNNSSVVDGRLKMSDISIVAVFGCDSCSHTERVIPADMFVATMVAHIQMLEAARNDTIPTD